ncbi:MAG: 50S ribosomal protein L13 [Elusimicrobia bacterium]|nr:50S ribosomal protein L13 [Elusimicrobiota bacterium]MBU2614918.1 50S ribosomal protein L13 [Elusimicrobiota bacterium]
MQKTYQPRVIDVKRKWHLMDANDKVLGRMATEISKILQGKHKPDYSKDTDCGDFIVLINASKVRVTGKKAEQLIYFRHTGHTGGDKYASYKNIFAKKPEEIIVSAVSGMLPKNKLRDVMLKRLKIYKDETHPHVAQLTQIG